ncbi:conserved hypothetical protein [Candidatus Sulfopaludibacter sp. SbA6]|nr:conserved hypothetical protein [Candidatus Sulfopaludibacter sp. SbA6]
MTTESLHVAVVDIGNLKKLGWVVEGPCVTESGTDIDSCIEVLAKAVKSGPMALGFEAPMFSPYGRNRCELDKARKGEGNRSYSASGGACSLTKGLVIVPYILEGLRCRSKATRPTFKWRGRLSEGDLLLFEAFVTHVGKSVSHEGCARLALEQFPKGQENRALFESAIEEPCTMNLLGAMLLRMGWTDDLTMLSEPCLVVRHKGTVGSAKKVSR